MNKILRTNIIENEQEIREYLNSLSEKELMIEVLIELKKLGKKCDYIAKKTVAWS